MKFAAARSRLDRFSGASRVALVIGGYLAAFVMASLALVAYVDMTSGPDRDASSGMYAFADALFVLLVLAAGSVAPTSLLLYYLRDFPALWRALGSIGLAVAITGWLAAGNIALAHAGNGVWSMIAVPRVFLAPLLLGLFVLVGMLSPTRSSQRWFIAAAGIEAVTTLYVFLQWFVPALLR
jgi:hypothetical protein